MDSDVFNNSTRDFFMTIFEAIPMDTILTSIATCFEFFGLYGCPASLVLWSIAIWIIFSPYFFMLAIPYLCAIFAHVYVTCNLILGRKGEVVHREAATLLALFWKWNGKIFHGYELIGIENIPKDGPAIFVYYHGTLPHDCFFLNSYLFLTRKEHDFYTIVDRNMFRFPCFPTLLSVLHCETGTRESCVNRILNKKSLILSPGGMRECIFSSEKYEIIWKNKSGFANIIKETGVPVIPMFTRNIRESFRFMNVGRWLKNKIFCWTKMPFIPVYGGFPVKLKTFLGDPILFEKDASVEEIIEKVKCTLEDMIKQRQTVPGSVLKGIAERFY